jgi:hypothetical protein
VAIAVDYEFDDETLDGLKFENYVQHFKIEDRRTGQLVPFVLNPVQVELRAVIDEKLVAGEPVRLIILKSRRMGVSTLIQATFAHRAFTKFRFTARTGAHEHFASSYLHAMTEQMYRNLPDELKPAKVIGQQGRHLEFETGSSLTTFTAKSGDGVGRSTAARAVHASEVAFWDDAALTMGGLRQTVPNEPETFVVIESTAKGVGDFFHTEWKRAESGDSDYVAVFFGWFKFPDYRMPVPAGGLGDLDSEEQALVANHDVDLEQLAWRRHTLKNECGGSLDTLHEEYPATPEEAFLSSGRPFFTGLSEVPTRPPVRVGEIHGLPIRGGEIRFIPETGGRVSIWEVPKRRGDGKYRKYVIGADVAGSVILAEHNARPIGAKVDAYCAYVVDVESGKTVARFYARGITEKEYARELAALGCLYDRAEIAVEKAGGYGTLTIIELRDAYGYWRLYEQQDDDSTDRQDGTGAYGFPMTTITRPLVLAALHSLQREAPGCLVDSELVGEMRTFVTNKAGKHEADTGCHDDRVMSRAIAARLRDMRATRIMYVKKEPDPFAPKKRRPLSIAERTPRAYGDRFQGDRYRR